MFVERIRTDLQLDAGPGELGQLRRQIVCPLQAGDRRPIDDDAQSCPRPLLGQIPQVGEDVWPVLDFGGVENDLEVCRDRGGGGNGWRSCRALRDGVRSVLRDPGSGSPMPRLPICNARRRDQPVSRPAFAPAFAATLMLCLLGRSRLVRYHSCRRYRHRSTDYPTSRLRWVLHAVGSELLRGRFRSAVPGFAQVGDRLAARGRRWQRARRDRSGWPHWRLRSAPRPWRRWRSDPHSGLVAADDGQDILMQAVHAGVGMRPRIGQGRRVEIAHELLHQGQLQQP